MLFRSGFSVVEKIYAIEDATGLVRLTALKARKPHSFDFVCDVHGNLLPDGLRQRQAGLGLSSFSTGLGTPLPRDKFVLFVNEMEFGNFYGRSDLEAAYRPWLVKDHAYRWLAMLLERLGVPPIFALYNPDLYQGSILADLKKIFANLQAATSGVIPRKNAESLEFWSPELAGQLRDVFLPALARFDADIARAVLLPQLLGFTSDQAQGSLARSQVHQESFLYVVKYLQGLLADRVMNEQVIRPLLALNFTGLGDQLPSFRFKPLDVEQRQALTDRWLKAVQTGVIIPVSEDERYLRELTSFPERKIPEGQAYTVHTPAQAGAEQKGPRDRPPSESMRDTPEAKLLTDELAALTAECDRLVSLASGRGI